MLIFLIIVGFKGAADLFEVYKTFSSEDKELEALVHEYKQGNKKVFTQIYKKARKHLSFLKGRYAAHDSFVEMATMKAVKNALDTYDPSKGASFKTHLVNYGKKMEREVRQTSYASHVSEKVLRDWRRIQRALDEDPGLSHHELAEKLKMKPERVKQVMDIMGAVESTSADFFITENHLPILDSLEGLYSESNDHHKLKVLQAIKELKTTNHWLISKHTGLHPEETQKHVRDILNDARELNAFL